MGVCSYCYTYQRDECFGWSEASGCCGIDGPDHPKRKANRRAHYARQVETLKASLVDIEKKDQEDLCRLKREIAAAERYARE